MMTRRGLIAILAAISGFGTFRKCRNVELESGMRTKADVPRSS
jgi:hypothetical protein